MSDGPIIGTVPINKEVNRIWPLITVDTAHYLIIGDKNTYADFDLCLRDWKLSPPTYKDYFQNIEGGDGSQDLTDALLADVTYEDRKQQFTFQLLYPEDYEKIKTELSNYFHGKRFDYKISFDPAYTYNGRFAINSYDSNPNQGIIVVSIIADPYKDKGLYTWRVNAAGGIILNLPSGRKQVSPIFEVERETIVTYKKRTYVLQAGTYQIRDLWFTLGGNEIVVNTYPYYSDATIGDYYGHVLSEYSGKRLFELSQGNTPLQVPSKLSDYAGMHLYDLAGKRMIELSHPPGDTDEFAVYIQYAWKDL